MKGKFTPFSGQCDMHQGLKASEQDIPEHKLCDKNIFSSLMESHNETQNIILGIIIAIKALWL